MQNELSTLGHNIETEFLVNKGSDNFQLFYVSFLVTESIVKQYLYHNV